jgi:hypothetical protein
LLTIAPVEL